MRTVIDTTPGWIFVKDKQHRFVLASRAFANSQELEPAAMLGRPDTDFWPAYLCHGDAAQDIRGFHADDDEAYSGRRIHNPAEQATLANGQSRWFDTIKSPLRDNANGKITGIVGYARDITERLNLESKAKREQSRMSALLSAMNIGILFEDNEQHIEYVNPAFLKMWGISEHDPLLNQPADDVLESIIRRLAQPAHAPGHTLAAPAAHEISEQLELELN